MADALVRAPLVDQAIAHLRDQIATGKWGVGDRLPAEPVLAQHMGVGRSTVREAVRVLAHAGVLEVRQGAGTFVRATTSPSDFAIRLQRAAALEVYEVRRALEVEAAGLAALRRTAGDLAAIDALVRRMQAHKKGDERTYLAADLAFHKAVVDAAHNPLLSALYGSSIAAIARAIEDVVTDPSMTQDHSALHDKLALASRQKDQHAAITAVRRHLDGTYDALANLVNA
ncbi:MAG TPA: FadR/GntR family transcriptional regulator [Acidothermaceae bacterium]|nr:FadR/GntR family transcriptional regulator [Acidothermaceae bacterium]